MVISEVNQWIKNCYGIDPQGDRLVIVYAKRAGEHVNFTKVSQEDPLFEQNIKNGIPCVGYLSCRESFTRWLDTPFSNFNKAGKVLPTLLDVQMPFPLESCIYGFISKERSHQKTISALAVATRQVEVEKKIKFFKNFNIDPISFDQEGLALWTQSLMELPHTSDDTDVFRVIVYLGDNRSTVVIGKSDRFLNAHSVPSGEPDQINRLLKSYFFSDQCKNDDNHTKVLWIWTGPGANDSQLVSGMYDSLKKEWQGTSFLHDNPEMFLARAVASRALLSGMMRCNLRTGNITHPLIREKQRKQSWQIAISILLTGIVLCTANIIFKVQTGRQDTRIKKAFNSLRDELAGYHIEAKGDHALKAVSREINGQIKNLQPFLDMFEPSLTDIIITAKELGMAYGLQYDFLFLNKDTIILNGTAGSWDNCEKLIADIREMGFDAKLTRKSIRTDERVSFSIASGGRNE